LGRAGGGMAEGKYGTPGYILNRMRMSLTIPIFWRKTIRRLDLYVVLKGYGKGNFDQWKSANKDSKSGAFSRSFGIIDGVV